MKNKDPEPNHDMTNGFSARPAQNGGWIITGRADPGLVPNEIGAFSDVQDMHRFIGKHLVLKKD